MGNDTSKLINSLFDPKVTTSQLQWKDEYRTNQILQVVISRGNEVTDSLTAEKLGWFFVKFASTNDGRQRACTNEVRELIVDRCFFYATMSESVQQIGLSIGNIIFSNPDGQRIFSTPETVAAIINALDKYATTPDSVVGAAVAIANIAINNPEGQRLLSNPETVSAISNALKEDASTPESTQRLGSAIGHIIANNPDGQRLFSTPEVASAIINALNKHATTAGSVQELGFALGKLISPNSESQRLFSTRESANAIIGAVKKYATTTDSAKEAIRSINNISADNPAGKRLFATPETVATFVSCFKKFASTKEPSSILCRAIGHICWDNQEGQNVFTTPAIAAAISYVVVNLVGDAEILENVSRAIAFIAVDNPDGQKLFSTPTVAESFLKNIEKFARTPSCVYFVCKAIVSIVNNNEIGLKHFATPEFIEAVTKMGKYAIDEESNFEYGLCRQLFSSFIASAKQREHEQKAKEQHQSDSSGVTTDAPPVPRVFVRGVPNLSFTEAVTALLSIRELPTDEDGNVLRPDLKEFIPVDHDVNAVLNFIERQLPFVKDRESVQALEKNNGIIDDDIRALLLFKLQDPYPCFTWLNALLMGSRRDDRIKKCVGPIFIRIYRAMEKLPKIKCSAYRGVVVGKIPALRATFDNYKSRCAPKKLLSFWGFSSFSRDDAVSADVFSGSPSEDAIIFACPELEGVDMEPFKPPGMPSEHEILPMCPAVFEVVIAMKSGHKLMVTVNQLDHEEFAYVLPGAK